MEIDTTNLVNCTADVERDLRWTTHQGGTATVLVTAERYAWVETLTDAVENGVLTIDQTIQLCESVATITRSVVRQWDQVAGQLGLDI